MRIYICALLWFYHVKFYVLIIMSISVKRHELWCTVRNIPLGKCSIIIIIFDWLKLLIPDLLNLSAIHWFKLSVIDCIKMVAIDWKKLSTINWPNVLEDFMWSGMQYAGSFLRCLDFYEMLFV